MSITVITEDVAEVPGEAIGGRITIAPDALADAIGWELKPEGLCRDDICVPVADPDSLRSEGGLDLAAVGAALGRRTVSDADTGVIALSLDAEARRQAIDGMTAPAFTLPDLDGNLHESSEWHGRRRMLFAFSSW